MRTLSLLRHAKSSWDDPAFADIERPLNARGRKAAPAMGRHMRSIGLKPDLVLCSTAVRTRETAALALAELAEPRPPVIYEQAVYEAPATRLIARLRRSPADVRHLLLIGHNPGLQQLVLMLAGEPLPTEHARLAEKLPTGALVVLGLDVDDWAQLAAGVARIEHVMTPRALGERG